MTTVGTNGGASPYGAFDMGGNVWEWNDLTGVSGSFRGSRGGAWDSDNTINVSSTQRFEIDPIPWGGNTATRVAANMGNAIFVAAYLIMVFPLTLGRIVDSFTNILQDEEDSLIPQVARGTVYVFIAAIQLITIYLIKSES